MKCLAGAWFSYLSTYLLKCRLLWRYFKFKILPGEILNHQSRLEVLFMRFLPSLRASLSSSCSEEAAIPPALLSNSCDDVTGQKKAWSVTHWADSFSWQRGLKLSESPHSKYFLDCLILINRAFRLLIHIMSYNKRWCKRGRNWRN